MFAHDRFKSFLHGLETPENSELLETIEKGFVAISEGIPIMGIIPTKAGGNSPAMTMQVETMNVYSNPSDPASADVGKGFSDVKDTPQSRAMDTLTGCEEGSMSDDEDKKKNKKKLASED